MRKGAGRQRGRGAKRFFSPSPLPLCSPSCLPMRNILLSFAIAYLLGSFPTAYLAGKLKGKNIFTTGSGNMGAMNTARNVGYALGVLVLLIDLGKGALATVLGLQIASFTGALAAGIGVILGHAYSVFVKLRGGKGLATALGVSLPLYPISGLAALVSLLLLIALLKNSNRASIVLAVLYPFLVTYVTYVTGSSLSLQLLFLGTLLIAVIIFIKHIPDLRRGV
jgi:acyl phosphate:glycerol-3-phosphate acyltransferase